MATLKSSTMSKLHSIHAYAAFDKHIDKVQQRLTPRLYPVLGCDSGTVCHRLMQRLVELTLGPYITQLARHVRHNKPFLHAEGTTINLDGISINTRSGAVGLTQRFLLNAYLEFTSHWLRILFTILCIGSTTSRGKATLVFGVGSESLFYGENDQRFVEYCTNGPIAPLSVAKRLIVQHATFKGICSDARVSYARHPIAQLACEIQISWQERLTLIARHLLIPGRYLWSTLRCPPLALLGRDFAFGPLMDALDRSGMIEAVVFTNSNYSIQPMWARAPRTYKIHMVWYGQNVFPLVMKGDDFTRDLPNYRYMQLDAHWVWTPDFRLYLMERGGRAERVEVVGPVTWYLPATLLRRQTLSFNIAVFDITPISDEYAESIGLLANYYCPTTAVGFLRGVLEAVAFLRKSGSVDCVVNLKHKRGYSPTHDRGYIEEVIKQVAKGEIKLIPFDINIYSFIADSDVVVVIPNSSPPYIATTLDIPSIYFDPTMEIQPTFEPANGISFASGADALCTQLLGIYKDKKARGPGGASSSAF